MALKPRFLFFLLRGFVLVLIVLYRIVFCSIIIFCKKFENEVDYCC